ncbi:MAG: orotidine 5'-phosphate decarboxylase [Chloroflexi bacterium]|nr:orotidine 5'-phosphate decarboxylase [Chloroflexota bacterium]
MQTARKINLQIALDLGERSQLLELARQVQDDVDWLEAGTPWIIAEGMGAVRALRSSFPDKFIVADVKIMDGGYYEAELAFRAGANLVTVLGVASDATISEVARAARDHKGAVVVDLMCVADVVRRAEQVTALGADYIGIHTASDDRKTGRDPIADLGLFAGKNVAPLIPAGGIGLRNIKEVVAYSPAAVVVGSAITRASNPAEVARRLREALREADERR